AAAGTSWGHRRRTARRASPGDGGHGAWHASLLRAAFGPVRGRDRVCGIGRQRARRTTDLAGFGPARPPRARKAARPPRTGSGLRHDREGELQGAAGLLPAEVEPAELEHEHEGGLADLVVVVDVVPVAAVGHGDVGGRRRLVAPGDAYLEQALRHLAHVD